MMVRKLLIAAGIVTLTIIVTSSCYYDVEQQLYPGNANCDTTSSVNYSLTVRTILSNNNCIGCHSGTTASGNVKLDTYAGVQIVAQNGKLYGGIAHLPGFVAMPQGGNKMSNCDIVKIKKWIDQGAINN